MTLLIETLADRSPFLTAVAFVVVICAVCALGESL